MMKLGKTRYILALLFLVTAVWIGCSDDDDGDNGVVDPGNLAPVISSLTADPDTFVAEQTTMVTVIASDPEGDPISYTWETHGSGFLALPGAGNYIELTNCCTVDEPIAAQVVAIVSDNHDNETRDSVEICVIPGSK